MRRLVWSGIAGLAAAVLLLACSDQPDDAAPPDGSNPTGGGGTLTPQAAATRTAQDAAAACPAGGAPGLSVIALRAAGVERSYRLYVPSTYDATRPLPLVLNFHGLASSAAELEWYTGFVDVAEEHGFLLVTPDGTNDPRRWYIYDGFDPDYVDDFAFVDELIDDVSARVCVDPDRVFATGISNGGGLASLLGCSSERIAAFAPVAGAPYSNARCRPGGPVPVIAFHGTDDYLIPFTADDSLFSLPITTVRENLRAWAGHNGCDLALRTERVAADVVRETYTDCDEDADVVLYVVEGGGHTWPGARINCVVLGRTTHSIDASVLIWEFFASR